MTPEERQALIEEVASAWRTRGDEGIQTHPAWEQLDDAGRIEAFEIAAALRKMEAALDPDGLSTTGRVVLERVWQQAKSDLTSADVVKLDDARRGNGQPKINGKPAPDDDSSLATVISFPKRIMQSQPWAVAAVALLVVGVGVWMVREREGPGTGVSDREALAVAEGPAPKEEAAPYEEPERPRPMLMDPGPAPQPELERFEVVEIESEDGEVRRELRPIKQQPTRRKAPTEEPSALAAAEPPPPKEEQAQDPKPPELQSFESGDTGTANAISGERPASATDQERKICAARVSVVEKLVSQNESYEPAPEEQLAVGRCYAVLGKKGKAKYWLERAAKYPETKVRAEKALGELDAE